MRVIAFAGLTISKGRGRYLHPTYVLEFVSLEELQAHALSSH